jgi:hypothetical protein
MKTSELNRFIDEFAQKSDSVKTRLSEMLCLLAEERVPSAQAVCGLDAAMDALRADYKSVRALASEVVFEDELPEEGSPVYAYKDAIERSERRRVAEKLDNISATVKRFISVRSFVPAFAKALAPYQQKAEAVLREFGHAADGSIPQEIIEISDAHRLFLTAMDVEDFGSDRASDLLDGLDAFYSGRVMVGLAQKKYCVAEEAQAKISGTDDGDAGESALPDKGAVSGESGFSDAGAVSGEFGFSNENVAVGSVFQDEGTADAAPESAAADKDAACATAAVESVSADEYAAAAVESAAADKDAACATAAVESVSADEYAAPEFAPADDTPACAAGESPRDADSADAVPAFGDGAPDPAVSEGKQTLGFKVRKFMSEELPFVSAFDGKAKFAYAEDVLSRRGINGARLAMPSRETLDAKPEAEPSPDCAEPAYAEKRASTSPSEALSRNASDDLSAGSPPVSPAPPIPFAPPTSFVSPAPPLPPSPLVSSAPAPPVSPARPAPFVSPATPAADEPDIERGAETLASQENDAAEQNANARHAPKGMGFSEIAAKIQSISDASQAPSDEAFVSLIFGLSDAPCEDRAESDRRLTQAVLLSKIASYIKGNRKCLELYRRLAAATDLFPGEIVYSGMAIASLFPEYKARTEGMMLASCMIALLCPAQKHDYMLHNQARAYHDDYDKAFPSYPLIKPLFHKLIGVAEVAPEGFGDSIVSLLGDAAERAAFMKSLREGAKALLSVPVIKAKMNGLPELCSSCFGPNSDLHMCMEIISNNNYADKDFVTEIFSEYSSEKDLQLAEIGERIDKEWHEATKGKRTNKMQLGLLARDQVEDAFKKRLRLMRSWTEHIDNADDPRLPKLKNLKTELLQLIDDASDVFDKDLATGNDRIVLRALEILRLKLSGDVRTATPFADLLRTGYISLDDDWNPVLDPSLTNVRYYEPWRNVLRHIAAPVQDFETIAGLIFDRSSRLFDNLHQLKMIGRLLNDTSGAFIVEEQDLQAAVASAENRAREFTDKLEMDYTYNRIDEADKEGLLAILAQYKEALMTAKDFACWRSFLEALEQQVNEISESRKKQLRAALVMKRASLADGTSSPLLDEAESLLERDSNYAVAEEYINRFDSGEAEFSEELHSMLHDADSFGDFISDRMFSPIYETCRRGNGRALRSFGVDFLDRRLPKDWTSRLREDSRKLIANWPAQKHASDNAARVCNLFKCIGLNVDGAEKLQHPREELYQVHISKLARNQADYMHPISAFGTQLKTPLSVVVLFGNHTAKQLVDTVASLNLGGIAAVLLDRPYDLSARRQMAEIFRTETSRQNPFLLIDQVLLLYLALHQETERLPVMLKCTLPYTTYQPFVRDGGPTADEMFCGRTRELSEIMNPGGACFVYGGRQLGKTALLERAESRCSKPESKEYAVYSNIIDCCGEAALIKKIVGDINKKTNLELTAETIQELCQQLDTLFRKGTIITMLLLLDEADDFLAAISGANYSPLQPLIDLKRESKNNFKFVFAGLHNVCRAQNATANNGVFGQLGTPLCVKPLSPTDARSLISRPLRYLGFQIDRSLHLETILTNTNYYPGILQFFGYTLVQTFNSQYAKYYRAADGHPPFTLRDEQLGAVMNSADLNRSIRDKFRLSLGLDPRYFMLARCITMLYHLSDGNVPQGSLGFSVDDMKSMTDDYAIRCLKNETRSGYGILLDEMVDMGILSKPNEGIYRLRRHSFINIIGSDIDMLDDEIVHANEEAG